MCTGLRCADTPTGERQELFIKKLKLCSQVADFADSDNRDKELKRLNLLEIMDYINTTKGVFNESTFEVITEMISANLFREVGYCSDKGPNPGDGAALVQGAHDEHPSPRLGTARNRRQRVGIRFAVIAGGNDHHQPGRGGAIYGANQRQLRRRAS